MRPDQTRKQGSHASRLGAAAPLSGVAAWTLVTLGVLAALFVFTTRRAGDASEAIADARSGQAPVAASPAAPVLGYAPAQDDRPLQVISGTLRRGQTLTGALVRQGVQVSMVYRIASAMRHMVDFRYAHPDDSYQLRRDLQGELVDFTYNSFRQNEHYILHRENGDLVVARYDPREYLREHLLAGVIAESGSFFDSVVALGESRELALALTQIFAWDENFSRKARPGDRFRILYERRYAPSGDGGEEYRGTGRILAARFTRAGRNHTAIYFEPLHVRGGYYHVDGAPVQRRFLNAPLNYRRISSHFSLSRLHPILRVRLPHPAIDYAAPTGTEVWSVADGTVIFRGRLGGFGKMVKVRHQDGYVSYYGHLSRFAPGLHVGKRLNQKEVVGYVGSTGLSTGPHLDYRLKRYGRYVNPLRVQVPQSEPIRPQYLAEFFEKRDTYLDALEKPVVAGQIPAGRLPEAELPFGAHEGAPAAAARRAARAPAG